MYVYLTCLLEPAEVRRKHEMPGTVDTHGCEQSCGYWDPNPGPWQGQRMLLIPESSPDR